LPIPFGINILLNQTRQQILSSTYIVYSSNFLTKRRVLFWVFFQKSSISFTIPLFDWQLKTFVTKQKETFQKGSQFYRLNHIGTTNTNKHSKKPHQVWFLFKRSVFQNMKRRINVLRVKRDHRLSGHLRH
jgi:hypothetical protein